MPNLRTKTYITGVYDNFFLTFVFDIKPRINEIILLSGNATSSILSGLLFYN